MSKQILEPPQGSHSRPETQANQPPLSQEAREIPSQQSIQRYRYEATPSVRQAKRRGMSEGQMITAVAAVVMAFLLVLGIVFSQMAATKTTSTSTTMNKPVPTVTVPNHQTYNAQAPTALQGSKVNVTLTEGVS